MILANQALLNEQTTKRKNKKLLKKNLILGEMPYPYFELLEYFQENIIKKLENREYTQLTKLSSLNLKENLNTNHSNSNKLNCTANCTTFINNDFQKMNFSFGPTFTGFSGINSMQASNPSFKNNFMYKNDGVVEDSKSSNCSSLINFQLEKEIINEYKEKFSVLIREVELKLEEEQALLEFSFYLCFFSSWMNHFGISNYKIDEKSNKISIENLKNDENKK